MEYGQPPCRAVVRHRPKLPCSYYAAPPRGVQPDPENPGPVIRPAQARPMRGTAEYREQLAMLHSSGGAQVERRRTDAGPLEAA